MSEIDSQFLIPFTDEHEMVRETVRGLVNDRIAPRAISLDESHAFPHEAMQELAELDLLGIYVPEEFGGAGMDFVAYVITMEELGRGCGSTALTYTAHTGLCITPITILASDEQKKRWLPELCSGKKYGCFGLSEPGSGTDAGSLTTTAVRDGDDYIINGTKMWITNGKYAGYMVTTCKTDPSQGRGKGISSLVVPMDSPGVSVIKEEDKLGLRASSTAQVFLDNVRVPAENLIGEENDGFPAFMKTLEGGRIAIAAMALGLAQSAYERSIEYAKQRETFGRPLAGHQTIQNYLADMAMKIEAARLLVYRAAFMKDAGLPFGKEASMAKLFTTEMAMEVTSNAIQVHGGYGYVREFEVERIWRDAKLCTIGEGTSEIQQVIIARNILGDAAKAV
ncbi:acyl-CoA dehydrogenase family protein [bacterium]|nr:acyl-CoA dehydrogenase family protein [bacterium]UNM10010.1 MAG: acyl-CoA dehydrogenase family protein [Planctomycetales bacterium]